MKKQQLIKESAKVIENISDNSIKTLTTLKESETSLVVDFVDIEHYEQMQVLIKEGFVSKEYRQYSITEKGKSLLEGVEVFKTQPDKYKNLIKEDTKNKIVIEYKNHDEKKNVICNETAIFDVEQDGIPVVVVNEDSYAKLLDRSKGQHWKQYLGEDGRNLVRQKKLSRFYVEDKNTGRRYLYIVPKV
jgi:hypothetical protein